LIHLRVVYMMPTIKLNDKPPFAAAEIHYVMADRILATELRSA